MNAKYPDRGTCFLLAKIYKPTWTKKTKFQVASLPETLWFWSCVGKMTETKGHKLGRIISSDSTNTASISLKVINALTIHHLGNLKFCAQTISYQDHDIKNYGNDF